MYFLLKIFGWLCFEHDIMRAMQGHPQSLIGQTPRAYRAARETALYARRAARWMR